ncbi:lysophospholipid acyltransferase family protein [Kiritimatiella glycovorans]|uniref:Phosphatidylinositol mannoside acyltransferase n=1 Tax=Kiritimatiella glycovorans TaxID=1307763 RepID=A0A0G3EAW4_9BACT|nr:lysophospholipid acyltransferase family protein [Kiritimatiella glycovorans]AKJ63631.1 Phosphatidylinositol mannoside acyltransferase [Kiritimatiella glycovorans]
MGAERRAMRVSAKHRLEYAALRTAACVLRVLPLRAALALGQGASALLFHGFRFRRREAEARIREVFGPELPPRRVRAIARRSMRNLCFNAVEMMRTTPRRAAALGRQTAYRGMRDFYRRHRERHGDGGFILATPHMGNWEQAGLAARAAGVPVFFIARRQKNPLVNRWINRLRAASDGEVISNDAHLLRGVARRLKKGGVLAILPDVRVRRSGFEVAFLGARTEVGAGTALFARTARVPVYPVVMQRTGWTGHTWQAFDPIFPDPAAGKDADFRRIMTEVMAVFDAAVREHPEQYFWYNKRWVAGRKADPSPAEEESG